MSDTLSRYHAQQERLTALEPKHVPRIRRALLQSVERCAIAVENGADARTAAAFVDPKPVADALALLYVAAGTVEARITYDYLRAGQKALAPPATVSRWVNRLKGFITTEGAQAVRGITDTTRKLVRAVLSEAAEAGDSVQVAARKLRERVTQVSRERAVAIVRTELVSAANYGSIIGAEATGLRLEKFWIATPDGRTRKSHVDADGQGAPLQGGFFVVGGQRCRFPGDPLLTAGERANCRCSQGFRAPSGLPAN